MTEDDYLQAREAWFDLLYPKPGGSYDPNHDKAAADALAAQLAEFKRTAPQRYQVVCCKAYYAGQGVSWDVGQEYGAYYVRSEAEAKVAELNACPWGRDCWELRVEKCQPSNT